MKAAFPRTAGIGCTTAGEISSGTMTTCSMVPMALPPEIVRPPLRWLRTSRVRWPSLPLWRALSPQMGAPLSELELDTHVGLILADGLSGAEEAIVERIRDSTDIPFVGGSAGDDLAFRATLVAANDCTFEHAAVLALLRVPAGYRIIKTQSFRLLGKVLTATVVFNCILRTLGDLFANTPSVGFSTYGEVYMGHVNQTATMLAFR